MGHFLTFPEMIFPFRMGSSWYPVDPRHATWSTPRARPGAAVGGIPQQVSCVCAQGPMCCQLHSNPKNKLEKQSAAKCVFVSILLGLLLITTILSINRYLFLSAAWTYPHVGHMGELLLWKIAWKQFDDRNQVQIICCGEVNTQSVRLHIPKHRPPKSAFLTPTHLNSTSGCSN